MGRVRWGMVVLAAAVVVAACGPSTPPSVAADEKPSVELARVGDRVITLREFEEELAKLPPQYAAAVQTPQGKRRFLDSLIDRALLVREGRSRGLDVTPQVKDRVRSLVENLVIEALIEEEIVGKVSASDAEARAYYDGHPDEYRGQEQVRARHILVDGETDARQALARVKGGEKFEDVANAVSKDKGQGGGDLGFFTRGQTVPEFEAAAFGLRNVGDISDVVKTQFGYHVIQLVERKAGGVRSFDEVREDVKSRMTVSKQRDAFTQYLERLKGGATVVIREEAWKTVVEKGGEAPAPAPPQRP